MERNFDLITYQHIPRNLNTLTNALENLFLIYICVICETGSCYEHISRNKTHTRTHTHTHTHTHISCLSECLHQNVKK